MYFGVPPSIAEYLMGEGNSGMYETIPYQTVPQDLADEMAMICQKVVAWFHDHSHVFLGDASVTVSDGVVRKRIAGYQKALDKELQRVNASVLFGPVETLVTYGYKLKKLPFGHQRALVEQWEAAFHRWMADHPGWTVTVRGFRSPKQSEADAAEEPPGPDLGTEGDPS